MTRIGWHAGMVRVDDAYAPMALAPSLIRQHALVGLYRMGDDGPEHVGNVYPDRTGENVVAMLDGKEWAIPWPTMVAMKMGRDFGIVASSLVARFAAVEGRTDVIAPDTSRFGAIRDGQGRIRGVRGFQTFAPEVAA